MTSLTRSSITGLYHPKRSVASMGSSPNLSLTDSQSSTSAIDRILHADKSGRIYRLNKLLMNIYLSGFLPTESLINSSHSLSNLDLSNASSFSLERSVLEAQVKRANSCNETMQASIKRLRTESQNSMEDLMTKNEVNHSINNFSKYFFLLTVFRTFSS
jgi:hypothetical protein